eukprot:761901-Hanusia_phi.AAC.1
MGRKVSLSASGARPLFTLAVSASPGHPAKTVGRSGWYFMFFLLLPHMHLFFEKRQQESRRGSERSV